MYATDDGIGGGGGNSEYRSRLQQALHDAGRWSYGIVFAEIWVVTRPDPLRPPVLVRPENGWWIDPVYHIHYSPPSLRRRRSYQQQLQQQRTNTNMAMMCSPCQETQPKGSVPSVCTSDQTIIDSNGDGIVQFSGVDDDGERTENDLCRFCRLTDSTRYDYIPPPTLCPGEGLPGILWQEVGHRRQHRKRKVARSHGSGAGGGVSIQSSSKSGSIYWTRDRGTMVGREEASNAFRSDDGESSVVDRPRGDSPASPSHADWENNAVDGGTDHSVQKETKRIDTKAENIGRRIQAMSSSTISWRNVKSIADDPDQPYNPRLQLIAYQMKLGWAAGVPFNVSGQRGIVMYLTRENIDFSRLQSPTNEYYLHTVSALVGTSYALREPRELMRNERKMELKQAFQRVRNKLSLLAKNRVDLISFLDQNAMERLNQKNSAITAMSQSHTSVQVVHKDSTPKGFHEANEYENAVGVDSATWTGFMTIQKNKIWEKLITIWQKSRGAGTLPPPNFGWNETFLSFIGSLVTMLLLARVSASFTDHNGSWVRRIFAGATERKAREEHALIVLFALKLFCFL
jgi:hypothetical protein